MDWNLKTPSWDLTNFERGPEPNIGSVVGLSGLGVQKKKGGCSVDLKLGRIGDFSEGSSQKGKDSNLSQMVSLPTSSKRTRALNNGTQTATCSVDGCNSDLSNCKDYHKRHKVCEAHAKTPIVLVGGQEQRFCQQCSRFHLLVEFDEVKRSCRKRLDGHNRRRRKPQPETLSMNTGVFSNRQGARFSSCITQMLTTAVSDPNWAGLIKAEEDALYGCHPPLFPEKQQGFTVSYSHSYKGGKQFPFLQCNDSTLGNQSTPDTSGFQPLLTTMSSSESSSKIFDDGLTQVIGSECALSLLSSPTSTPSISVNQMVQQTDQIPMAQPLVMGLQYDSGSQYSSEISNTVSSTGFSCSGVVVEQMGSVLVSSATDTSLQCQDILNVAGGVSLESGASHSLPFSWQ